MKQYFISVDDINELQFLNPWLLIILGEITLFCTQNNLMCRVTSILRPVDKISESKTHQEGRAVDIGVIGWPDQKIKELCDLINEKFDFVGAISKNTGKPMACYYHNNGNGWHFHVQVRPLQNIKGVNLCLSI